MEAANLVDNIIVTKGCNGADESFQSICQLTFDGPFDPLTEFCKSSLVKECPRIAQMLVNKTFSPNKVCTLINMC